MKLLDGEFKAVVTYGHCRISTGFVQVGNKFIGMGTIREYDREGRLHKKETKPTGLVIS